MYMYKFIFILFFLLFLYFNVDVDDDDDVDFMLHGDWLGHAFRSIYESYMCFLYEMNLYPSTTCWRLCRMLSCVRLFADDCCFSLNFFDFDRTNLSEGLIIIFWRLIHASIDISPSRSFCFSLKKNPGVSYGRNGGWICQKIWYI